MDKAQAVSELKSIGLEALEKAVKSVVLPYVGSEAAKKNPKIKVFVDMLMPALQTYADGIHAPVADEAPSDQAQAE